MAKFYLRDFDGVPNIIVRVTGNLPEQWTPDGWVPSTPEYSGIGGSTDYTEITRAQAEEIIEWKRSRL